MNFTKTAKTIADQVTLLKSRGLKIENEAEAAYYLSNISYYRLSAYFLSFQVFNDPSHTYMPWATFNRVIRLYTFDRELRLVLLDAIERIEVTIRCRIIYEYCHKFGANWYEDSTLFTKRHGDFLTIVQKELNNSREVFISHYKTRYTSPALPPAWMTLEILSFGQLSTMYKNLRLNDAKKAVAAYFGVNPIILESWMEHLVYIRNSCAHHSRIWNRTMTVTATIPTNPAHQWITLAPSRVNKIYTTICIVAYLLERTTKKAPFAGQVKSLLRKFPEIDLFAAGFNKKWKNDSFWKKLPVSVAHRSKILFFRVKNTAKIIKRVS